MSDRRLVVACIILAVVCAVVVFVFSRTAGGTVLSLTVPLYPILASRPVTAGRLFFVGLGAASPIFELPRDHDRHCRLENITRKRQPEEKNRSPQPG